MSEFSGQETVTSTTTVNPQIETLTAEKVYATEVQSPTEPIPAPITKTVEDSVVPDLTAKKETTKTEPIKNTTEEADAKDVLYKSPDIKFDDDPAKYIQAKFESLIYWEYPKKSALYLGSALGVLILTQYYSVLQLLAAFFTLATAANWVYVNTHKQTQRLISGKAPQDVVNPHSDRLQTKGALIPRDRVTYAAQLSVDVFEVIAQQVTKLILIEDNTRSAIAVGVSYLVWTLAKYISTKYLVGFFLISAFSLPRLYLQHQTVIDAQVAEHSEKARVLAKQYGGVAYAKAQDVYQQALGSIKKEKVKKTE
ncbi:Reticulon-domain-containing protein [Cunninghamella echinulata]|nr:Reticulon-domain-containing protein [Cunninghamella echinulata]